MHGRLIVAVIGEMLSGQEGLGTAILLAASLTVRSGETADQARNSCLSVPE